MLVSFVIPAYQAESVLRYSVAAALAQRGVDVEVIVSNDGSTDRTAEVADDLAAREERVTALHGPNRGPSGARNAAVEQASGELVAFMDADDIPLPGYAARLAAALEADSSLGLAFCDAWVFDSGARLFWRRPLLADRGVPRPMPPAPAATYELLVRDNFVSAQAMVRRDVLREVGYWDEGMRTSEDWDLWLRILQAGRGAAFVDEPLVVYQRRPGQATANADTMAAGRAELWRKHGYEPPAAAAEPARAAALAPLRAAWSRVPAPVRRLKFFRATWPPQVRRALAEYGFDDLWGQRP